jgi:hypothetical protein
MTDLKAVAVQGPANMALADNMSISQMKTQVQLIQKVMSEVMQDKQHYGVVPGCGDKKVLLKPGAEKLSLLFRLAPHFEEKYGGSLIVTDLPGGHKAFEVHCAIVHIPTEQVFAIGVGICTTMETKYRYRNGNPICPYCQKETVFRSKKPGEGYYCWKQKGGCGATFPADDEQITSQKTGRREHDNPADYYNTCIKIGKKRSYIDGIVSATACGDIFTQDLDRTDEDETGDDYIVEDGSGEAEKTAVSGTQTGTIKNQLHSPEPNKNTWNGILVNVETKTGTGKKGPWTRYGITINHNNETTTFGTFSDSIGITAVELKGKNVIVEYSDDGKYKTVISIKEPERQPGADEGDETGEQTLTAEQQSYADKLK